ncbi:unnamed protein product, partial [Cladocopium goreaui]
ALPAARNRSARSLTCEILSICDQARQRTVDEHICGQEHRHQSIDPVNWIHWMFSGLLVLDLLFPILASITIADVWNPSWNCLMVAQLGQLEDQRRSWRSEPYSDCNHGREQNQAEASSGESSGTAMVPLVVGNLLPSQRCREQRSDP